MDNRRQDASPDLIGQSSAGPFHETPSEVTTLLAHYYRAEMGRMTGWRDRLDRTSNWAITVVAALLSVSLSTPTAHHGVLLFAMLLVVLLLYVEARRYRFYDVYRQRIRQFERHYFSRIFSGTQSESEPWLGALALELRHPTFHISIAAALRRRLKRNYIFMFGILLLGWILKISSSKLQEAGTGIDQARPLQVIIDNAALGPLPGWATIVIVALFYGWLAYMVSRDRNRPGDDEVHV
jgi:uncharacterized membrane protein